MRGTPGVNEKDWKLFRSRIPEWQEAYMDKLNQEYIRLLSGERDASDKFWELEKRIRMDKKSIGVVADMRRSQMYSNLISLIVNDIIREEDLDGHTTDLVLRHARLFRCVTYSKSKLPFLYPLCRTLIC